MRPLSNMDKDNVYFSSFKKVAFHQLTIPPRPFKIKCSEVQNAKHYGGPWTSVLPPVWRNSPAAVRERCQMGRESRRRLCTTIVKLDAVIPMGNSNFRGGRWGRCVGRWHFILLSSIILAIMGQPLARNLWKLVLNID